MCEFKMQVTDVRKPLMSVSKICDAGHSVTFRRDGGEIVDDRTGQMTKFNRIDDVYQLVLELPESDVHQDMNKSNEGFSRQAM